MGRRLNSDGAGNFFASRKLCNDHCQRGLFVAGMELSMFIFCRDNVASDGESECLSVITRNDYSTGVIQCLGLPDFQVFLFRGWGNANSKCFYLSCPFASYYDLARWKLEPTILLQRGATHVNEITSTKDIWHKLNYLLHYDTTGWPWMTK